MDHNTIFFTAGQFAKMHNINKRTLHYYDEIGLFSPIQKGENGYRYYTYLQSPNLEMILTLRELGMSIEAITDYMAHRSMSTFSTIIEDKMMDIDHSIKRLKKMYALLEYKQQMTKLCQTHNLMNIDIVDVQEEYLLLSKNITGDYDANDFAILMEHTQTLQKHRLFSGSYGSMIAVEKIIAKDFDSYSCFFSKVDKKVDHAQLFIKPKGKYIRAFCKGNWDTLPDTYVRILDFANTHQLTLTGYAFEEGINEMAIDSIDEYITQIYIQCK